MIFDPGEKGDFEALGFSVGILLKVVAGALGGDLEGARSP